jgi:integrase
VETAAVGFLGVLIGAVLSWFIGLSVARRTAKHSLDRWAADRAAREADLRKALAEEMRGNIALLTHALARIPGQGLQLVEPKTASSKRTLALPDVVVRALRSHRARQLEERLGAGDRWQDLDLVFTTLKGRPLQATHVLPGSFRRIRDRAGIGRLRFHDCEAPRRRCCSPQGLPQRVVMEQLGHTTLAMTQHYTNVVPQLMKDAAAAMDRALGS